MQSSIAYNVYLELSDLESHLKILAILHIHIAEFPIRFSSVLN